MSRGSASARFTYWMRTGLWLALDPDPPETKFNPYHDPANGRFTSAPGVGAAQGLRAAAKTPGAAKPEPNHIVQLNPLSAADVATVHGIAATPSITQAMDRAWQDTLADGKEHGFIIYQDADGRYFAGRAVTGSEISMGDDLYGSIVHANALTGDLRQVVAYFHTHPGDEPYADNADSADQNFGTRINGITIILTSRRFIVGK